jgi:hypothetical protein
LKASFDAAPPRETLVGSVERVTFHNDDNGFAVLKVKARGKRDLVPVVGHVASISAGKYIHANVVGTSRAVRIFKTYGHDAIQVMTEDPYRLARDIRGIGFRTADAIAMKLGMTRKSPQRVRAGISFALQEATDEGHCGLPVEDLIKLATTLLEVDPAIIRTALTNELSGGEVVADTIGDRPCVFLRGLYLAERGIAERLLALAKGSPSWPVIDVDKAIPWVEKKTGKTLAASQRADHQDAMAAGLGVTEFNETGAAAFEIRQLWNWIDCKLQPKVKKHVKAA